MNKIFDLAGYLVVLAVFALLLAAAAVFVYGGIATINIIIESFQSGHFNAVGARLISIEFIEMIDLFLLGTILMMTSLGLYQLVFNSKMELPEWLVVADIEQLKFNLLAVIVVMLAIMFLGEVAGSLGESEYSILDYGLAIAAVLVAIALVVWVFQRVTQQTEDHIHKILQDEKENQLEIADNK